MPGLYFRAAGCSQSRSWRSTFAPFRQDLPASGIPLDRPGRYRRRCCCPGYRPGDQRAEGNRLSVIDERHQQLEPDVGFKLRTGNRAMGRDDADNRIVQVDVIGQAVGVQRHPVFPVFGGVGHGVAAPVGLNPVWFSTLTLSAPGL